MLIYVIEDDDAVREIEVLALRSGGYEVEAFNCVGKFRQTIREKKPDLIVLDIMLPDGDGVNIVEAIRNTKNMGDIPIILVSARNSEIEKVKGLDAGADDYITKPFGIMELLSRVKALLRRAAKKEIKLNIVEAEDIVLNEEKREVNFKGKNICLTYKEFELLKYLMVNKGIVLSRDKIMENVWGFDFQGESRTVDMHIKTLRKKLYTDKEDCRIETVRNVGYKFC